MENELKAHLVYVNELVKRTMQVLKIKNVYWRPMTNRVAPVNTAKDYSLGYTDLNKRIITIDILTPKKRKPKRANGILRVLAHEIAHLQKPPYRQRHRGRIITRMHFPKFYKQVNKNIAKIKKDTLLGQFFHQ